MKRLITSMLIVLLISVAFICSFYKGYYCYAIENEDSYRALTNDELDAALYAYIQSRGGGLSAISYEAMHTYNRGKIDNSIFGDGAEYSRSDLLGHIHVGKNQNDGMYFDFDGIAAGFLNTRFRKMLQDNVFGEDVTLNENGMLNPNVENEVYKSGELITLGDGKTALVWKFSTTPNYNYDVNPVILEGTYVGASPNEIPSLYESGTTSLSIQLTNNYSTSYPIYKRVFNNQSVYTSNSSNTSSTPTGSYYADNVRFQSWTDWIRGCPVIVNNNGSYYICIYSHGYTDYGSNKIYTYQLQNRINFTPDANNTQSDINILFYSNINNNIVNYPDINADGHLYISPKVKINGEYSPYTVNNNQTINQVINNYYNDGSEKDKTITEPSDTPPTSGGGGSGGSGGSGGTPPNWSNPYPNLSPDGSGGFNFNFTLPDLNIDWNINGLSEKFPFSIPFDLIRFITVLNAEPETPHFEGTVNLIVYQWDIDADLSQFDNLASIVRNVEFIGFCITLILITRKMIKG